MNDEALARSAPASYEAAISAGDQGAQQFEDASDVEGLAAAARVLHVRVVELEAFVQAFAREVELGAVEYGRLFGSTSTLHAVALEHAGPRARTSSAYSSL